MLTFLETWLQKAGALFHHHFGFKEKGTGGRRNQENSLLLHS